MKGSVFNGFENFVIEKYGLTFWQQLIDEGATSTNGVYLASEIYSDDELKALLLLLGKLTEKDPNQIQRDFGQYIFPVLFNSMKEMIGDLDDLFEFLIAVDELIHVEVQKLDPQTYTPALFYDQPDNNTLLIRYISKRKMCYFAEGLILGAAATYKTPVTISQTCCMNEGEDYCILKVER